MPPGPRDLTEVRAVGEIEQDRPCSVQEAGGKAASEGAGQGVVVGVRGRVADVGAGDQRTDAAQRLLVGDELQEELAEPTVPS